MIWDTRGLSNQEISMLAYVSQFFTVQCSDAAFATVVSLTTEPDPNDPFRYATRACPRCGNNTARYISEKTVRCSCGHRYQSTRIRKLFIRALHHLYRFSKGLYLVDENGVVQDVRWDVYHRFNERLRKTRWSKFPNISNAEWHALNSTLWAADQAHVYDRTDPNNPVHRCPTPDTTPLPKPAN